MGYMIPRLVISLSRKTKNNSHRFLAEIVTHKQFDSHHFPKYFHIIKKRSLNIGLLSTPTLAFFF
jgi:hypothetical protein